MNATVYVIQDNVQYQLAVDPAGDMLTALQRSSRLTIPAPCGGAGTCGKCVVRVVEGDVPEANTMDKRLLSSARIAAGARLACRLTPTDGMKIEIPNGHGAPLSKATLSVGSLHHDPHWVKRTVTLPAPSIDDQTPDLERVLEVSGCTMHRLTVDTLRSLSTVVRRDAYQVTVLCSQDRYGDFLHAVEPGDTTGTLRGVAVDIGTTTVAVYLIDLLSGRAIDVHSELNRQAELGADVITRISYSTKHGVDPLRKRIVEQINRMISTVTGRNGIAVSDLYLAAVAGNTTMLHFFLGLDAAAIGVSPFIPAVTRAMTYRAAELGISANLAAVVTTLPCISAYVGADVVAAIVASRMRESSDVSLLVDVGTNGEIVLGNSDWLITCSTAAGPAFEGAQIRFGVGGVDGAVNSFAFTGETGWTSDRITYTTINSAEASGICGAGLLDVVATLLKTGVIDETGRLLPDNELPDSVPAEIRERCHLFEGSPAFLVVPGEQTRDREPIYLTEKDVREIQLAKAAIAAGVDTLADEAGIQVTDIARVYLAGGFGSFMSAGSALTVGLIPLPNGSRTEALGNAAGIGTAMSLTSRTMFECCNSVATAAHHVELSGSSGFREAYVNRMTFSTL